MQTLIRSQSRTWTGIRGILCLLHAGFAPGAQPPEQTYLLQVLLDRVVVADVLNAVNRGEAFFVPLGALCQELDLAIQVDPAKGEAKGFLVEEGRTFHLEARTGSLRVGDRVRALDRNLIRLMEDDIYLDTRLLGECLPLEARVDPRGALLRLETRERLPIQARWVREQRTVGMAAGSAGPRVFEPFPDPFRWAEWPSADLTLAATRRQGPAGVEVQGSLLATGDLAGMTGTLQVMAQQPGGTVSSRLTLGRKDPRALLLGPLRATEFGLGEILAPGMPLATAPAVGTGAFVTNQDLRRGNTFDRRSFQGELQKGWQVELYQNGNLVGFQGSRGDGRYAFMDVPLFYGPNEFRLVFYGPQGQRREERDSSDISQNQVPKGTFTYHASSLRIEAPGGARTQVLAGFGLTRRLSVQAGWARSETPYGVKTFGSLGLERFWTHVSGGLTLVQSSDGGRAVEATARTMAGPFAIVARHAGFGQGFTSELLPGAILDRTSLVIAGPLPSRARPWLTLDMGATRDHLPGGGSSDTLRARAGTSIALTALSAQFSQTHTRQGATDALNRSGLLLLSRAFGSFALRGQATWRLDRGSRPESLALLAETSRIRPWTFQVQATLHAAAGERILSLNAVRTEGAFGLGTTLSRSSATGWSAGLNVRIGAGRDPHTGRWLFRGQGAASQGAVSARVFLDRNGNGRPDPGEPPLPGVGFLMNESARPQVTDATGTALLGGLPEGVDVNLAVRTSSLDDALMRCTRPGDRITPRPGHVASLDIPIVMVGEVNGTVYGKRKGTRRPLGGLRLDLADASGRVIRSLRTAFDGFYTLSDLRPGSYSLVLNPDSAQRLGIAVPAPIPLRLEPEGTSLDGVDMELDIPPQAGGEK